MYKQSYQVLLLSNEFVGWYTRNEADMNQRLRLENLRVLQVFWGSVQSPLLVRHGRELKQHKCLQILPDRGEAGERMKITES